MLPTSVGLPLLFSLERKGRKEGGWSRSQPARAAKSRLPPDSRAGRSLTPRFPWTDGAGSGHLRLLQGESPGLGTSSLRGEGLEGRAAEERRTASSPGPPPLHSSAPRGRPCLSRKTVQRRGLGSAAGGPRGGRVGGSRPEGQCGASASRRATWTLPVPSRPGPCVLSALRLVPIKPKPQEGNNYCLRMRLNCVRLLGMCVRGSLALLHGQAPHRRRRPSGSRARPAAARSRSSGADRPGPAHSCARRGPREAGRGAARVASRTLNL